MPARSPEDMPRAWCDAYNRGDLDALMELYEPTCVIQPRGGPPREGRDAIRAYFRSRIGGDAHMTTSVDKVLRNGDLALCYGTWALRRTDPAGTPRAFSGHSVELLRRQADGTWCYVIDDPFAGEPGAR